MLFVVTIYHYTNQIIHVDIFFYDIVQYSTRIKTKTYVGEIMLVLNILIPRQFHEIAGLHRENYEVSKPRVRDFGSTPF